MNNHSETSGGGVPVVPLDAIPEPVIHYSVRSETPVLEDTNEAFDSAFGEYESGTTVRQWLESLNIGSKNNTVNEVCRSLVAGERINVDVTHQSEETGVGSQAYRLQSRSDSTSESETDGYLMVTQIPATDDAVDVDQIASVISHELRNPLDVAKAHLTAARDRGDEEHLEQLADAHDRMERIIQDVLTLARNEDAITPSPKVELSTVASEAWAGVDTESASLVLHDGLPTIKSDSDQLQRLFENLFRNSVEHARPGGDAGSNNTDVDTKLRVQVGTTDDGGFFVADNGTGIPPEEHDRIFDPGYTSSETGIGLGLAIVEQIAEAHGWTVSITAETSGGARFEFRGLETAA